MTKLEQIEKSIAELSPEEMWDRQIEADVKAGKLDKLVEEARADIKAGRIRDL